MFGVVVLQNDWDQSDADCMMNKKVPYTCTNLYIVLFAHSCDTHIHKQLFMTSALFLYILGRAALTPVCSSVGNISSGSEEGSLGPAG